MIDCCGPVHTFGNTSVCRLLSNFRSVKNTDVSIHQVLGDKGSVRLTVLLETRHLLPPQIRKLFLLGYATQIWVSTLIFHRTPTTRLWHK